MVRSTRKEQMVRANRCADHRLVAAEPLLGEASTSSVSAASEAVSRSWMGLRIAIGGPIARQAAAVMPGEPEAFEVGPGAATRARFAGALLRCVPAH